MSRRILTSDDIHHVQDGEWYDVAKNKFEICCDCGLTHRMKYRQKGKRLQASAARDPQETTRSRRREKFGFARR
jgi:hypothetical protein